MPTPENAPYKVAQAEARAKLRGRFTPVERGPRAMYRLKPRHIDPKHQPNIAGASGRPKRAS